MKKKVLALILSFLFSLPLIACTTYDDWIEVNHVQIGYSKLLQNCFIGGIRYKKGEDWKIVLPSVYKGYTINELGGYIGTGTPSPFGIFFEGEDWFKEEVEETYITSEEYLYTDFFNGYTVVVEDIFFEITLPNQLERIKNLACQDIFCGKTTDTIYVLRPVYRLQITETNSYFYTKEDKLYDKKTNELIENFTYTEYQKSVE